MTISRKLTSVTTAIALAAASVGTATTASAHDRDGYRGDYGRGYGRGYEHHHDGYRGDRGYRGGRDEYYGRHYRKKDHTGKYVAIGAAALMLGIIASEASRR